MPAGSLSSCAYIPLSFHSVLHPHRPTALSVLCGLTVYFLVGFLFLKFARGAEGVEAIPQGEFWLSLPGLVKDGYVPGWILSFSLCVVPLSIYALCLFVRVLLC